MKIAGLFLLSLFTTAVFAGVSEQSSWEEINSNRSVVVDAPKVAFGIRFISVMDLCIENNNLRTTEKVRIEKRIPISDDLDRWVTVKYDFLYTPIRYKKLICIDHGGDRCELEEVWQEHKLTRKVAVREPARGDNSFGRTIFSKPYSYAVCSE